LLNPNSINYLNKDIAHINQGTDTPHSNDSTKQRLRPMLVNFKGNEIGK
jgi:hypothetical protein